jgi:hypothetical protein
MRTLPRYLLLINFFFVSAFPQDVAVYGATPAGVAAAITAARAGHATVLLEPSPRVGGMLTGGLSYTDFRTQEALTGFFREYMDAVLDHYVKTYGKNSQQVTDCFFGALAEPKVSSMILQRMLAAEKRLTVQTNWRLESVETTSEAGGQRRIVALRGAGGKRIMIRAAVDATYEGDLAAAAGVPYRVGRESSKDYGERFAGKLFVKAGVILPGSTGEADRAVQCYNFRILMTTDPALRVPVPKPADYRRDEYAGVVQHFLSGQLKSAFTEGHDGVLRIQALVNGKADINDIKGSPLRLALPGETHGWPEGSVAERERIYQRHKSYALGLLWFLQNDEALPDSIRAGARQWGFAKDEFVENGHFATDLYVREARRIEGEFTFTERDTQPHVGVRAPLHVDSIAIGDYALNSHGHGKAGSLHPNVADGDFNHFTAPFQIPYGTIVPKQVSNLLVPVALSASHIGFSALRLEPTWTALGHAAGLATHLAIAKNLPMAKVAVDDVQQLLLRDRAAILYTSDVSPGSARFAAVQKLGLRGFLHDIAELHAEPFGVLQKRFGLQHTWPFPHHALRADAPLDAELRQRWLSRLTTEERAKIPARPLTRGEFIDLLMR